MLYLVLILVIGAFALLVAALTTANTVWAWISVGLSVVAAGLLVFDWLRGRRRLAATSAPRPAATLPGDLEETPSEFRNETHSEAPPNTPSHAAASGPALDGPAERVDAGGSGVGGSGAEDADQVESDRAGLDGARPATGVEPVPAAAVAAAEPGEEPTDAADLLVVSELTVEVRVVDEHPRYHLARCAWLEGKQTIALPVAEARELGFTPCARCGPDAVLAARQRAGKGAER